MSTEKVSIFGGNGFVGTHLAEALISNGNEVTCISRSGHIPAQLENVAWAEKVQWLAGDASEADSAELADTDVMVTLVGSPPVPTFSKKAYEDQVWINSQPNLGAMKAAEDAGIKRMVILGAHLPWFMNTDKFGYAKGKRMCLEAAKTFVEKGNGNTAIILQPTAIFGTRHNKDGDPMKLEPLMGTVSKLQGIFPKSIARILPEQLVSIHAVTNRLIYACFDPSLDGKFTMILSLIHI